MEVLGITDLPLWLLLFGLCLYLLYRYSISPFDTWKRHGVAGPRPLPFFGNILDLYNPDGGFHKCIASWESQYGKVIGFYFMRRPALIVTDMTMLKHILVKQFNDFTDRFFVGDGRTNNRIIRQGVFFAYGTDWQRIRHILSPTFSSGKLKHLIPFIDKTAHHLSDYVQGCARNNTMVDAKDAFGAFALDTIAGIAFDLDINSLGDLDLPFRRNAKNLMTFNALSKLKIILGGLFPFTVPIFEFFDIGFFDAQSCNYFEKSVDALLSQRKNTPNTEQPKDFLQLLLSAEADNDTVSDGNVKDKRLTSKEIAAQCVVLIIAGYESVSAVLQFLSYALARNKSVQTKVFEEIQQVLGDEEKPNYEHLQNMKYTSLVIYETLRMYPPVNLISREAAKACNINGISLPQKSVILIPVYNIGRNPSYFEEPDEFKPDRFLNSELQTLNDISFLPFGFGPRHCIGMRLGMMEIKIALIQMLRKVSIEDATPKVLEIEDFSGLTVPKVPIKLKFHER